MPQDGAMRNSLFFGDNLEVLRTEIADASVDLIYLDPPFNSAANYAVLCKSSDGRANEGSMGAHRPLPGIYGGR